MRRNLRNYCLGCELSLGWGAPTAAKAVWLVIVHTAFAGVGDRGIANRTHPPTAFVGVGMPMPNALLLPNAAFHPIPIPVLQTHLGSFVFSC